MKKLYTEATFIRFNNKRSEKGLKRRIKLKRHKRSREIVSGRARARKRNKIKAPETFSVANNTDATISFFSEIISLINEHKPLYVNLKPVIKITPDAILYLLVLLQEAKIKRVAFNGNAPMNKKARDIFTHSGFYDFVNSSFNKFQLPVDSSMLKIKSGTKVDGEEAENIQKYLKKHVHDINSKTLKAIYGILIECMSNTNEYAGKAMGEKHWWTMTLHEGESEKVMFAFVDNGVGIPATVKKRFPDILSNDATVLEKTMQGSYQMSGSKKKTRNKGLPQIRRYSEEKLIRNLVLVSNKGYYSLERGTKQLEKRFIGTLLTWEFV